MAEKTEKKPSSIQRLFEFAGNYKYLAVASWILAAISAFVLKDGVVAESGTPEELKKKDGIYANMMKTQLMAADWSL